MTERNERDTTTFSKREVARAQSSETNHSDHSEGPELNEATTSKQPQKQRANNKRRNNYQNSSTDSQIGNN